jgi:hypothetical protein
MKIDSLSNLKKLLDSNDGLIKNVEGTHANVLDTELRRVADVLGRALDVEFASKFDDQDRTDFGQISIPLKLCIAGVDWAPEIRFSCFSPLIVIFRECLVNVKFLTPIVSTLEGLGYVYVPERIFLIPEEADLIADAMTPETGFGRSEIWSRLFDYN